MTNLFKVWTIGLLASCIVACGGTGEEPTSPAQKVAHAAERLRGSWLLVEFRPEQQLEPVLASLLGAQIGRLTVFLDGNNLTVQGVGVRANRQYTVDTAGGEQFTATVIDPMGVKYGVAGAFVGQEIAFTAQTAPWRGSGRLQRAE